MPRESHPGIVSFARWELDLSSHELRRGQRTIPLPEKPFLVLEALALRPGAVITRKELVAKLWPDGTTVDFDNNLNTAVAALRQVLQDTGREHRIIETIPRLGYRLTATRPPGRLRRCVAAFAVIGLLLSGVGWYFVRGTPPRTPRPDARAHRAFLRAVFHASHDTPESLERALSAYREAITFDPGYGEAHAGAADVSSRLAFRRPRDLRRGLHRARAHAENALAEDDGIATAHRVLGMSALLLEWDFDAARNQLARALELAPDDAYVHMSLASYHSAIADHDAAIAAARRASELDPASLLVRSDLGFFYLAAMRYHDAIASSRESLALEPGFEPALRVLLAAAERLARDDEAAAAALALLERNGVSVSALEDQDAAAVLRRFHQWDLDHVESLGDEVSPLARALKYAAIARPERALDMLEESLDQREGFLVYLSGYAELAGLRSHPRFRAIAARIGLPPGSV